MQAHPDATAGLFGTLMAGATLGGVLKLTGALGGLKTVLGAVGRMLGFGGAAAAGAAGEGAAAGAAAGGGLMSTLGLAGALSWLGLQGAKAAGLPDVNRKAGIEDVQHGRWLAASSHLSAGDFLRAMTARASGKSNAEIAAALASGELKSAAQAQRDASKVLVDAAKELAGAVSTNASAAEAPTGGTGYRPPAGNVTSGNAKSASATFMKMGWSREQAAALAANLNIESGLRPNIVGDNGAAYGIAQWHADRQAEFKRVFGHDIRGSSLDEQLQFVNYELTRGREQAAGRALRLAKSAGEAGAIVSAKYERPLRVEQEMTKRSAAATSLYGSLGVAGAANTPAPMMATAYQAKAGGSSSVNNSHNRVQTHIGTVNVYGSDTSDGHAVAAGMRDEINQNGLIAQGAWGMT
ncbi:phage tail tip lysozyme [Caballeronia catudaia]|nr:phage tail tip lysozyme [Caballeronia catudaia]